MIHIHVHRALRSLTNSRVCRKGSPKVPKCSQRSSHSQNPLERLLGDSKLRVVVVVLLCDLHSFSLLDSLISLTVKSFKSPPLCGSLMV